jgi:hypothetical protein
MAEQEQKPSGGGWLRNIASIFVEMPPEETTAAPKTPTETPNFVGKSSAPAAPAVPTYTNVAPASADFVDDLRKRFKKILEDKNQPNFDFYEFSLMLLRTSNNPTVDHFKTAYEGAKLLNPSCNQQFLLQSADFYKKELQSAFEGTLAAGEQKKTSINNEKANEQKQLNAEVNNIEQQLGKLRQQIADLEKSQREKMTAIQGIDAKFEAKFIEIEQKLNATVTAKDGVMEEIALIENGIKQYLS